MVDKLQSREAAEPGAGTTQPGAIAGPSVASANAGPKPQDRRAQQRAISHGLRQFFDSVVSEPIPDEFVELLKKIDQEKSGRSG